ncbi:MAG: V-type ATP synthase subunit D [Brevinematales bacterium]
MAIKYQFNKLAMQAMQKQIKIRQNALPTLKSKETALRLTVKRLKEERDKISQEFDRYLQEMEANIRLWAEFPDALVLLEKVVITTQKIAGVKTPDFSDVQMRVGSYSLFHAPMWYTDGIGQLEKIARILSRLKILERKMAILDYARRKTTQKVNLYEKVQIPAYEEAIRKIKRFLEDVDNLEKSAQKITKQKVIEGGEG